MVQHPLEKLPVNGSVPSPFPAAVIVYKLLESLFDFLEKHFNTAHSIAFNLKSSLTVFCSAQAIRLELFLLIGLL